MDIQISVLIDKKAAFFSVSDTQINRIGFYKRVLELPGQITDISIAKNLFIVTTRDPNSRGCKAGERPAEPDYSANNITAYDWDGNFLWNIAEIVGDIGISFFGRQRHDEGCV